MTTLYMSCWVVAAFLLIFGLAVFVGCFFEAGRGE